jgi:hypothetical protein
MACLLLFSAAAATQQVWLGTFPGTIAAEFRGQIGRRLTFICPATPTQPANVWGTDTYTDDSMVCPAAIHAGVLQPDKAGVVTIVMGVSAESFQGSSRNGVTSQDYGPWSSSYTFSRTGEPGQIDWKTAFMYMPIEYPDPIGVVCLPGGNTEARIWGTDVYTYDSSICVAGVHAGIISPAAGGKVTVMTYPRGLDKYPATTRNGVSSLGWAPEAARDYPYSFAVATEQGLLSQSTSQGRTIKLAGFTANGTAEEVVRRTIVLAGFTASGTAEEKVPRTIRVGGWTGTGSAP